MNTTVKPKYRTPEELHLIHRAKIRLMNRRGWSEEQAYTYLRRAAMNRQLTLVAVARLMLTNITVHRPARKTGREHPFQRCPGQPTL